MWESLSKFRQNYEYFVICEYKNTGTYHIFPAEKEGLEERCVPISTESCCGRSFNSRELRCSSKCLTEDKVRLVCAKMANEGKNICGVCVATFYSLEDEED